MTGKRGTGGWLFGAALIIAMPFAAEPSFSEQLVSAANERTQADVTYDGRYIAIDYPGGMYLLGLVYVRMS